MGDDDAPSPERDEGGRGRGEDRGDDRGERDHRRDDRRDRDRRGPRDRRNDGPPRANPWSDRGGGRDRGRDRGGGRDRRGGGGRGSDRGDGPPRNERKYFGPKAGHERRPMGGRGGGGGERILVLPGEEIRTPGLKPGFGTYRSQEDGKLYASVMGLLSPRPPFVRVIPLTGRYIPQRDDLVVGVIQAVGPTYWLLDIRAPHFTPLHMTGTPWKMEYGECGEYLRPGETVLVRVEGIDEMRRIGVSMNGPGLGKLEGGYIAEVSPTKVPRVIGKSGSMIQLIQQETGARLVVGQNGRVWIEGDDEQIRRVREVLHMIDEEGQKAGLTDRVKDFLEGGQGRGDHDRGSGERWDRDEGEGRGGQRGAHGSDEEEVHDGSPPRPPKGEIQGPTYIEEGQEFEEESQHG